MLRLLVLFAAVACHNACRLDMIFDESTDSSKGCPDSEGTLHELDSEWDNGTETCVCVNFGIICCQRVWDFESTVPPELTTAEIVADDFGAFTWNDDEEPEKPEEPEEPEEPQEPEEPEEPSSNEEPDSPEDPDDQPYQPPDSSEVNADVSHISAEDNE